MSARIICGDCREVVPTLDAVDAVVCDPPYGLEFMGKGWDKGVPGVEFWSVILAGMKPGAHLVAFGGTRTFHRLTCAIEDAGFEIRDCLSWLYGTGFPKSLNVEKAIDKHDGTEARRKRDLLFTAWMRSTGITSKQINEATDSNMGNHYLTDKEQPAVATLEMFDKMAHLLPEPPPDIVDVMRQRTIESENFKRREVTGQSPYSSNRKAADGAATFIGQKEPQRNVTAPATDAAKTWDGWGTALKPAWEPIILARKPLVGTVAANVLEHGTGAVNVDGTRIGQQDGEMYSGKDQRNKKPFENTMGRWPANVVLDEETAAQLGEPSRFFYCAKASKAERGEGNKHPTVKPVALMRWLCRLVTPPGGTILDPFCGSGSTGVAAKAEGFEFIGIDLDTDYCEIAERRLA